MDWKQYSEYCRKTVGEDRWKKYENRKTDDTIMTECLSDEAWEAYKDNLWPYGNPDPCDKEEWNAWIDFVERVDAAIYHGVFKNPDIPSAITWEEVKEFEKDYWDGRPLR